MYHKVLLHGSQVYRSYELTDKVSNKKNILKNERTYRDGIPKSNQTR